MTTNYKRLCAELLSALENEFYAHCPAGPDGDPLIKRARAALAEPDPEGPTDEEIMELMLHMELMLQQMRDDLAAAARAMAGFDPDNIKAASVFRISECAISIKDSLRSLMIEVDDLLAIATELEPQ